ncbi:MAG: arylamine N-acetyltransferase [Acidobacteriota bacterium]
MNIEAYLRRINYTGPTEPSVRTLRELHVAHLLRVPFENLDNHLGREIVLEEDKLVSKILDQQRGGICYELNGAFAVLLRELGFDVAMLSAGVARAEGGFDPPFDHMTLIVRLEQRWLADVGFGDSFREPLLLDSRDEQAKNGEAYRLVDESDEHLILERREGETWKPQYRFTLQSYELPDFAEMCRYHQTSPESPFTQRRTCSLATPEGRITVTGMRLIKTVRSERDERELSGPEEYAAALREHFGVTLDGALFK